MKKPNWRPVPNDPDVPPFEPTGRVERKPTKPDAKSPAKSKPVGNSSAKTKLKSKSSPSNQAKDDGLIPLHVSESGKTRHVLYISEYEGRQLVSVRQQYIDKETGEWKFGKNGVSIPFERSVLVRMARGAKKLAESIDDE